MWPFKPSPILDADARGWMLEAAEWALRNFGGRQQVIESPLVLPTAQFFTFADVAGHARAERIFMQVKDLAGMAEWPCVLEEQPEGPGARVGEVAALQFHRSDPAGTFAAENDGGTPEAVITYNTADLHDPVALIATFAHELAHYLISGQEAPPPGGWDLHEPATDYLAVFMGFGIFLANSNFEFSQYTDTMSQGWQARRRGYLTEDQLIYALAQFLSLKEMTDAEARLHLKAHLRGTLRKALAELERDAAWAAMRAAA